MVLATDILASMLALTQEAARAADLRNVQTRVVYRIAVASRSG
jgi:hypothetical protein